MEVNWHGKAKVAFPHAYTKVVSERIYIAKGPSGLAAFVLRIVWVFF